MVQVAIQKQRTSHRSLSPQTSIGSQYQLRANHNHNQRESSELQPLAVEKISNCKHSELLNSPTVSVRPSKTDSVRSTDSNTTRQSQHKTPELQKRCGNYNNNSSDICRASNTTLTSPRPGSSQAIKSLMIVVCAYFICMTPFCVTKLYKVSWVVFMFEFKFGRV